MVAKYLSLKSRAHFFNAGTMLSRMDVEVSGFVCSDNPQGGGRLGMLGYQILGDVHPQFLQLREVHQLLLVELSLGLHTKVMAMTTCA